MVVDNGSQNVPQETIVRATPVTINSPATFTWFDTGLFSISLVVTVGIVGLLFLNREVPSFMVVTLTNVIAYYFGRTAKN